MTMPTAPTAPAPLLLDAKRAASLCGVSRATWFSWQASGAIPLPALRRGRVVRWSARELTAWIEKGCPARDRWTAMKGAAR